jgi:predicted DNA binding CopG/RHH family protein
MLGYSIFMKACIMTDNLDLDIEEQDLLDSYERDEWQSVSMLSEKIQQYQAYAAFTFEADGLVSVVLSKDDLIAIQQKAIKAGISYQSLIANIIHQFVSGNLTENSQS